MRALVLVALLVASIPASAFATPMPMPQAIDAKCTDSMCEWTDDCTPLTPGYVMCRFGLRHQRPDESDFANQRFIGIYRRIGRSFRELLRINVYDGPLDVPDDEAYRPYERQIQTSASNRTLIIDVYPASIVTASGSAVAPFRRYAINGNRVVVTAPP